MTRHGSTFPLLNRVVVLVLGGLMFVAAVAAFVMPRKPGSPDFVEGVLLVVFGLAGAAVACLSLFWKPLTGEALELERSLPVPDRPDVGPGAVVYLGRSILKTVEVILDRETGTIHFRNCHVPRGFLTSADAWFSCRVDELNGVHLFRNRRSTTLTIVTPRGRAEIPSTGEGYQELHAALAERVRGTRPGYSADHPMMGMTYVAGAIVGLFAGVFIAPRGADESVLGACMLAGAILGVVAARLLVWIGDRYLQIGLTQPVGYGLSGALVGVSIGTVLPGVVGWNLVWFIVPILVGFAVGVLFGFVKQSGEMAGPGERLSDGEESA